MLTVLGGGGADEEEDMLKSRLGYGAKSKRKGKEPDVLLMANCSLRSAHCALLTALCSLRSAHGALLIALCSLRSAQCALLLALCSMGRCALSRAQ